MVRVIALLESNRKFDGSDGVFRAPQVGDIATICHDYDPSDPNAPVAVEMVNDQGLTIWLADFDRSELELVTRQ